MGYVLEQIGQCVDDVHLKRHLDARESDKCERQASKWRSSFCAADMSARDFDDQSMLTDLIGHLLKTTSQFAIVSFSISPQ